MPIFGLPACQLGFQLCDFLSTGLWGTQLNDGTHNFTCYDSTDIATQAFPNQSANDVLNPGLNINHVLCNTVNASKSWNFGSCATATTAADAAANAVRFDCGCTAIAGTCTCGDGGVTVGDLEAGCSFDPVTCEIVCAGRPDLAADLTGPDTLTVSIPDAYTLSLVNVGTVPSVDGTATIVLPAGMTALPATVPSFCSVAPAGSPITCDLSLTAPIPPGGEEDITFSVLACTPGTSDITAAVTGVTGETNLANNTATMTVTVDSLPPVPEPVLIYSENFSDGTPQVQPGGQAVALQAYTGGMAANFEFYAADPAWLPVSGHCNGWIMMSNSLTPNPAMDLGCSATGGPDGLGVQRTAWWFQEQLANVIGLAQGMTPPDAANNAVVSAATNSGLLLPANLLQLETLRNATQGKAGHYYQVSGYFAAVHCPQTNPGSSSPIEDMDLVVDGAPVPAVMAFNPCIPPGVPGFSPYIAASNTQVYVGHAVSAPIQLSTDATLGLRVRNNATPGTSGNDGAFDMLQIFDVTSQVDQCL